MKQNNKTYSGLEDITYIETIYDPNNILETLDNSETKKSRSSKKISLFLKNIKNNSKNLPYILPTIFAYGAPLIKAANYLNSNNYVGAGAFATISAVFGTLLYKVGKGVINPTSTQPFQHLYQKDEG